MEVQQKTAAPAYVMVNVMSYMGLQPPPRES